MKGPHRRGGEGADPAPAPVPATRTAVFVHLDLGEGGAQRQTLRLAGHLDPGRYAARIVCARGAGALVAEGRARGLDVRTLGRLARPWDSGAVAALARALRAEHGAPDVVAVPRYSRVAPYAALAARRAGARLLVLHDHARYAPPPPARRLADAVLMRRARYVAVAEALRADLVAEGVAPARIAVVPPGIEIARYAAGDRAAARAALGLAPGVPVLLVPARLDPMKGHRDLLAAMPAVRAAQPAAVMLCAGDGPARAALDAGIAAAGLGGAVRLLGARADMPDLLAAADLVTLASRVEGLPAALLEAGAAGRPVVATAVGGVPELVRPGQTGWLAPPGAPAALAEALVAALADPAEARRRAAALGELVRRRHAIERVAGALADAWDGWLAELARGRRRGR